jgi:GNAT superfamily N-acetyltransferase
MNIGIRFGLPIERGELEDLQRRASLAVERYRADLLAHPEAIHLPLSQLQKKRVRVAEIAGRIVGFSAVLPKTAQIFDLDGLFVEPDRWRCGIGRALIADALHCARAQGGVTLEVVANPAAEAFYEKLKFEICGHAETQFGPARLMRQSLQPS